MSTGERGVAHELGGVSLLEGGGGRGEERRVPSNSMMLLVEEERSSRSNSESQSMHTREEIWRGIIRGEEISPKIWLKVTLWLSLSLTHSLFKAFFSVRVLPVLTWKEKLSWLVMGISY